MVRQIPFTKYEAALLLDAYLKVLSGELSRVDSVKNCSQLLRLMAVNEGIEIDETYRNVNGISFQMASMESAYQGKTIMKPATQLFTETVQLFRDNNKEYHNLLNKAKNMATEKRDGEATALQMCELCTTNPAEHQMILEETNRMTGTPSKSVEDAFFMYAKDKTGFPPKMLVDYLQKAADYCHLKQPLLGMTDAKAVHNVQKKVAEGKLLRFRFGKNAQAIRSVTQLYYAFIKSYCEPKEDAITQTAPLMKDAVVEQAASDAVEQATAENVPIISVEEVGALDEIVETAEGSALQGETTSVPANDQSLVDFSQDGTYLFTKPVSYTYKGEVYPAKSWNRIYVEICGLLFADYRDAFMGIMNEDFPGYNTLAFADERNYRRMRVPKSFAPGYYLESNLDATTIVRKIRGLHQLFGLGDKLRISYRSEDGGGETSEKAPNKDWIIVQLKARGLTYQDKRNWGGCLWIVGDHGLDAFIQECRIKGYKLSYKADGCKTYPNRPVWWTKDHPKQPIKATPVIPTGEGQISLDAFKQFLIQEKGLADRTAGNYSTSIRMIEAYIQRNHLDFSLLNADATGAQKIFDFLMARPDFEQINIQRHRQFSAALVQFVIFLRQDGSIAHGGEQKLTGKKTIIETVFDVLRQAGKPMTVSEIYQAIIRDNLYPFGAQNPQSVVYSKVSLAYRQTDTRIREGRDVLIRAEKDGRRVFQVMSAKEAAAFLENQQRKSELETASPWVEYEAVLKQAFPKGFQKESVLDMKKLRKRWAEIHGEELRDSNEIVRLQLTAHCVDTGKRWYLAELLLSDEDRWTVLQYIERVLNSGKPVLYYSSIYAALEHQLESAVLTEDLLVSYLLATCQDRYILREHYLTNDRHAQVNLPEEITDVMLAYGRPIHTDELKQALHHFPPNQVERELHIHSEFIMDAFHTYFHESMADLTAQELDQIAAFIQEELDNQGYMIGDWIQRKLVQLYPETAERLSFLTPLGVRGAVAYKLRNRFTFSGPVITLKGNTMSMTDIFAMFCQRHAPFTLDELTAFAKECDSTIYMDTVHRNCARVSETEFVETGAVRWDIPRVDAAIALHCPGKYVSLKNIQYFDAFPYVGYSWNSYLLEQYVATVSKNFTLMHSSYAKNNVSGAIVRRDAGLDFFDDVLADILANAPVDLEKDPCLEHLANAGYITRKKLSSINEIITRAKMLRSQKG